MKLKHKNILVYGLSISGEWVSKLLLKKKANVYLYDDDINKTKRMMMAGCYMVEKLHEDLLEQFDSIVISPSIDLDNEHIVTANRLGIRIYSELEIASLFTNNLVAVTGTNGKTTTVELITAILNKKYKAVACGNIGYPLSRAVIEKKRDIKVCEVSSFMLEHATEFAPHVATILNISPDHIIRHKTMERYIECKTNLYSNLNLEDYVVINLDETIRCDKHCRQITYSVKHHADIDLKDGYIRLYGKKLVAVNELGLKGIHNIYNIMCAVAYGYIYKVSMKKMREAVIEYKSEHFRNELIAIVNDIKFINDSKSTNISSTLASVNANKGAVILLLGGSKKGLDYKELFDNLSKRVKKIFAFGEISDELVDRAEGFDISKVADLKEAFKSAVDIALSRDTILLSPASASYDQFTSYIERGNLFNSLVREYESRTEKE